MNTKENKFFFFKSKKIQGVNDLTHKSQARKFP